jgi:ketol-acid reductoisomerase
VIRSTGGPDYKAKLGKELKVMHDSEMWRAGAATRALRPKEPAKASAASAAGVGGRKGN